MNPETGASFRLYPLRFHFQAKEALRFPPHQAANILRGALGVVFRRIACAPGCVGAKTCANRYSCPYAQVFEPSARGAGPSGLADWPRPFVLRARQLDGRTVEAGERFWFDLHVFLPDTTVLEYLERTFAVLAEEGFGPKRARAELQEVTRPVEPILLDLRPGADPVSRIRVAFLTPTELKHEDGVASRPEFPILFGRIRDRIATLSRLYGPGPLAIDFTGTNQRAAAANMTLCEVRHQSVYRRSSRTGQVHTIGGFTGVAEYEGDLAEFLPWLEAAGWVGAGRQCVWGKGEIRVETVAE